MTRFIKRERRFRPTGQTDQTGPPGGPEYSGRNVAKRTFPLDFRATFPGFFGIMKSTRQVLSSLLLWYKAN